MFTCNAVPFGFFSPVSDSAEVFARNVLFVRKTSDATERRHVSKCGYNNVTNRWDRRLGDHATCCGVSVKVSLTSYIESRTYSPCRPQLFVERQHWNVDVASFLLLSRGMHFLVVTFLKLQVSVSLYTSVKKTFHYIGMFFRGQVHHDCLRTVWGQEGSTGYSHRWCKTYFCANNWICQIYKLLKAFSPLV